MLSVSKDSYITIIGKAGEAKQVKIAEALGDQEVYDTYGVRRKISVVDPKVEERMLLTRAATGEVEAFGESHTILCRIPGNPRWARRALKDLAEPVLVRMIQRKIFPKPGLFELFDGDDKGLYLEPRKATDMFDLMRKAAWNGITVSRRKTELRIDLDKFRPPCFTSKLITGSFQQNLETTLGGLVASGVISNVSPFNDDYLKKVNETGTLFEGDSVVQVIPLLPAQLLEKPAPVYHIHLDWDTPVELLWHCS